MYDIKFKNLSIGDIFTWTIHTATNKKQAIDIFLKLSKKYNKKIKILKITKILKDIK